MKKEGLLRVLLVPCDTTQLGTSVLPRYLVVLYHKVLVELAIVLCPINGRGRYSTDYSR